MTPNIRAALTTTMRGTSEFQGAAGIDRRPSPAPQSLSITERVFSTTT